MNKIFDFFFQILQAIHNNFSDVSFSAVSNRAPLK